MHAGTRLRAWGVILTQVATLNGALHHNWHLTC